MDALDKLTHVAQSVLGTATTAAAVTAVTADSTIVVSISTEDQTALPGASVPLSHSMSQHVVIRDQPYIIDDASTDPAHALASRDLGLRAYAGFPLRGTRGTVIGAVSVFTTEPRHWSPHDLQILESLTTAAQAIVTTHTAARHARMFRISGAMPADTFARVQHNLRTPLTSLLGFLELLLEGTAGEFNADQSHALRRCLANAERLREAVEALS
jgi:signal transduction histidine kinase